MPNLLLSKKLKTQYEWEVLEGVLISQAMTGHRVTAGVKSALMQSPFATSQSARMPDLPSANDCQRAENAESKGRSRTKCAIHGNNAASLTIN
jgi:hypothetical protein